MDHLPLPKNAVHGHISIPLFTHNPSESVGNFLTYPDRSGFRAALGPKKSDFSTASGFPATLQQWLFFGLIQAVTGFVARPGEFTKPAETGQGLEISTRGLYNRVHILTLAFRLVGRELATHHYLYAKRCVFEAFTALEAIHLLNSKSTLDPRLLLSLAAVGEFFRDILYRVPLRFEVAEDTAIPRRWPGGSEVYNLIAQQMLEDGWCPRQVTALLRMTTSAMYFVSRLGRPGKGDRSHQKCNINECRHAQIDEARYQTKHAHEGCACQHIVVPQEALTSILDQGHIPVIAIDPSNRDFRIEVVAAKHGLRYTAISHVWSDGLGNPSSNSLPQCQLLYLTVLLLSLEKPDWGDLMFFWIDTLCCPVRPNAVRNLAISKMRETYSGASQVLVIDSWLESTNISDLSLPEICTRILVSEWNNRLWTLQEGALAKTLKFAFKDGAFTYKEELFRRLRDFYGPFWAVNYEAGVAMLNLKRLSWLRSMPELLGEEPVRYVFNGMCMRMTTKMSDEAICIATLLDLDALEIVEVQGESESERHENRMVKLWSLLGKVPYGLLFMDSDEQRLRQKGFRWAPRTLRRNFLIDEPPWGHGSPTASLYQPDPQRGITFRSPGLLLYCPMLPLLEHFYIRDPSHQWHTVTYFSWKRAEELGVVNPHTTFVDDTSECRHLHPWSPEEERRVDTNPSSAELPRLALITSLPVTQAVPHRRSSSAHADVILAVVEETTGSEIFVRGFGRASLLTLQNPQTIGLTEAMRDMSLRRQREEGIPFGVAGCPPAIKMITKTRELACDQVWVLD